MRADLLPTTLEGKKEKVVEEIGELLKAMGKVGRFGWHATDAKTGISYDNRADVLTEARDVVLAVEAYVAAIISETCARKTMESASSIEVKPE